MAQRLDAYLTEHGIAESRTKAAWMITEGMVMINGKVVTRSATIVEPGQVVTQKEGAGMRYVGKGGFKLEKALRVFNLSLTDAMILDVGASTGGFTDCALQHGAAKVVAVDVGIGQLHAKLAADTRVHSLEEVDIRTMPAEAMPWGLADFVFADVSFLSLRTVIPAFAGLAKPDAQAVVLVKPQFEQDRRKRMKGGIVRSEDLRNQALEAVTVAALAAGWQLVNTTTTDADGKTTNLEYLLHLQRIPHRQ